MSDTLDLGSNNLCIPEDAFEKFQSISMYEEPAQLSLARQETSKGMNSPQNSNCGLIFDNEVIVGTEIEINTIFSESNPSPLDIQNSNNLYLDTCVTDEQLKDILEEDIVPQQDELQVANKPKEEQLEVDTVPQQDDLSVDTLLQPNVLQMDIVPEPDKLQKNNAPQQSKSQQDYRPQQEEIQVDSISQSPKTRNSRKKRQNSVYYERPSVETKNDSGLKSSQVSKETLIENKSKRAKKTTPRKSVENELSSAPSTSLGLDQEIIGGKRIRRRPKRYASSNVYLYSSDSDQSDTHRIIEPDELPKSVKSTKNRRSQRKSSKTHELEEENHESLHPEVFSELCETLALNPVKPNSKSKSKSKIKILSDVKLTNSEDLDNMTLSQIKQKKNGVGESKSKTGKSKNGVKHVDVDLPLQPHNKSVEKTKGRSRGRARKKSTIDNTPESISTIQTPQITNNENKEIVETMNLETETISSTTDSVCNGNNSTSQANTTLDTNINESLDVTDSFSTRNTKMPTMSDFEYNIDSGLSKDSSVNQGNSKQDNSSLAEDSSKRPKRKKGQVLHYQEESDEDPYANIELSDDSEPISRKGKRYYSDDEYVPGRKELTDENSTDSEVLEIVDEDKLQKKKRVRSKKSDSQSPRKKTNKDKHNTTQEIDDDDIEVSLQGTVIKGGDEPQPSTSWACSDEFENFLAKKIQGTNLKIKKVSSTNPSETKTLEIPMIDSDAKRTIEMCTQTNIPKMASTAVQTSLPYDVPMKEAIALTAEQSEKACEFLTSIVNTTSELGTLMTQKSEDFIKKKINTNHVNDTMKVDYCVKKSFLLLKLAKHNLTQMEEDLGKQYEIFLNSNGLAYCREAQKEILSTPNEISSDSDCEIVEEPIVVEKPNGNRNCASAKKIFLNKELSIKIKKKTSENKTLNILKSGSSVWLGKTVVKKVQSNTQSFLAQDSRNKKPPDNKITTKMVSDFFKNYNHQRVMSTCASFVTTDWLKVNTESVCNYFVVKPLNFKNNVNYPENGEISMNSTASNTRAAGRNHDFNNVKNNAKCNIVTSPETLFKMCYRKVRNQLHENSCVKEVCQQIRNELADGKKEPVTLLQLSLRALGGEAADNEERSTSSSQTILSYETSQSALPLKKLCYQKVVEVLYHSQKDSGEAQQADETSLSTLAFNDLLPISSPNNSYQTRSFEYGIKSLFKLCVEFIQRNQVYDNNIFIPKTLKSLSFKSVQQLLYGEFNHDLMLSSQFNFTVPQHDGEITTPGLTINSVNTLSEEAFLNLEESHADGSDRSEYFDDFVQEDHYESEFNETEDNNQTETNWVSQVQLKELRSCVNNNNSSAAIKEENMLLPTQIKIEPAEELPENEDCPAFVKTEPTAPGLDEMTMFPGVKPELDPETSGSGTVPQNNSEYSIDAFEEFVTSNKLVNGLQGCDIYSQSAARVRRQHEPDYYEEVDTSMSLLVPQTYEPLSVDTAKGSLMETSSDEDISKSKKGIGKKKVDKRNKSKNKKLEQQSTSKDVPAQSRDESSLVEVANLTKKMRDRITQEEERDASTDSENEDLPLRLRRRKDQQNQAQTSKTKDSQSENSEIQCNNVDSTDKVDDVDKFTGFTAIDQNEMSTYKKYMEFVYDKIMPKDEATQDSKDSSTAKESQDSNIGELISPDEPVELLECEPTMPIFDDIADGRNENIDEPKEIVDKPLKQSAPSFVDRHGWHCYPLDPEDTKLYLSNCVVLEKLPGSFFNTYFEYQNMNMDENDAEINRLTNLNTLTRAAQVKEVKSKKSKRDATGTIKSEPGSDPASPSNSDHYEELEPSDDEGTRVEDEVPPPMPQRQTENAIAKNLLMDDNNSDADEPHIKEEPLDKEVKKSKENSKTRKSGVELSDSEDLMLTADKVMNKELNQLHAPVVLDEAKETPTNGPVTRNKQKNGSKNQSSGSKVIVEDDSSSEEEKQWVTTKEKLLKRLCRKEDQSLDDAKRAKLVTEFIERRTDCPDSYHRPRHKSKRTSKKVLERQKQLRVLSRELFGEPDPSTSKRSQKAQASLLYKGRRNIRKVIDKKSLARSTVVANMEEFERKRRLNARQAALRERLGCEEGVNVLVINDEVCLEYDFEANRPIVTVHSFFTKVMKAHQYEGVKFMWDACFESVSELEAGRGGGGCILAHCMGLGKTLQVLALLHTVLTHPRVGIKRVLVVCPLSTVLNWVDEIHKWIGPVTNKIKVFELSKLKKTYERAYQLEDWFNGGGIFIIGYELFRSLSTLDPFLDDIRPTIINKIRTALLDPGPDIIVCDEGHLLKNDCSVLSVAMSRVVTKRRIILTGTPMQNNLREYYCMVNFVKPNLLGTYAEYSNRFENPIMNGQHRDSREEDIKLMKARTHILHKVLEGCLQRQEASVLYPYLPKKHEYTLFITQTACQWKLYKHYLNHYGNQSKQSILKDFHILQKIWSHPQVLHNFQTKAQDQRNKIKAEKLEDDLATEDLEEIKPNPTDLWWLEYMDGGNMLETLDSSNKFVVVFRILDECIALGDKVLIFSTSLFCLDALEYFLKKINKWSLGQEYFRLDGSVPAEVRQKWCREFNADSNYKTKLFLVSTRAGCLGLNMTAANRVIILDTSWNPAHDIQSIFRVYRFGQKKDCFIYRLVAMGTMEQKIYERSVTKQAVACRVVDEQQIDRHYNMADLTELYKFDELGSSVAGGVAVGVADVALLRVARLPALHAVHEHDSLLRGSAEQGLPEHERDAAWVQFQQEQAHKQIENELLDEAPKTATKRLHGHDYALSPAPADIKTEDKSDDFQPSETKSKKGKKIIKCLIPIQDNKNNEIVPDIKVEPTPTSSKAKKRPASPEPGPSIDKDAMNEEIMVEKITDILLKHNFQYKKGRGVVGTLVSKVRSLVMKGYIDSEDKADELTSSIADVLLPKQVSVPMATNIMCESINNSAAPCYRTEPDAPPAQVRQKPGPASKKKGAIPQDNTPRTTPTLPDAAVNDPSTKTKRRAAIQAEKHIDYLVQDVIIDLDDDDNDAGDADFVPVNTPNKSQKKTSKNGIFLENANSDGTLNADSQNPKAVDVVASNFNNNLKVYTPSFSKIKVTSENKHVELPKPVPGRDYSNSVKPTVNNEKKSNPPLDASISILLSDDEEPISAKEPSKTSKEPPKTSKAPPKISNYPSKKVTETPKITETVDDEVVPLPATLLRNENFINIVAYTYLSGNPMLDEDAAKLAAQYSTLKAFDEVKRTGKDICSGPIYDIAIKVVGKDVLKKMQVFIDKTTVGSADTALTEKEMTNRLLATPKSSGKPPELLKSFSQAFRNDVINGKLGSTAVPPKVQRKQPAVTITPIPPGVVPVGLVQMANNSFGDSGGECILPDSENTITNNQDRADASVKPAQIVINCVSSTPPKKPVLLKAMLEKPLNEEKLANSAVSLRKTLPKPDTPVSTASQPLRVTAWLPTSPASAPVTSNAASNYISLDSDEEDTATKTQPTARAAITLPQETTITSITPTTSITPVPPYSPHPQDQSAAMPVPVSLTMANAPSVSLSLLQNHAPVVTPTPGRKTLVVKQVSMTGQHRKILLVPSDKLASMNNTPSITVQPSEQPQSPPPPESQPELQPVSLLLSKTYTKAKAKAKTPAIGTGDILKVSKSGKIAIIQKPDSKVTAVTSAKSIDLTDVPSTSKPSIPKASTVTINLTDEITLTTAKPKVDKKQEQKKAASKLASQSNGKSSSSSDESLSIFKDVVQIQASDYSEPPRPQHKHKSSAVRPEKSNVSLNDKKQSTLKTADGKKLTQVPQSKVPKHINAAVKIKIEGLNKTKALSRKEQDNFIRKAMTSIIKPTTGKRPEKRGSGSKTKSSATAAPVTVDLTNTPLVYASSITSSIGGAAKRLSSNVDKATAKKKKTEPMTLKDFDLDDFDDIIELE